MKISRNIFIALKRKILLFIGVLLLCVSCTGNNSNYTVSGSITCEGEPLVGVVVTDGYNFAQSSQSGHFELDVKKTAQFVSVVTPSGYITDFADGVPDFYIPLSEEVGSYDFNLRKWGEVDNYQFVAMGDIQTKTQIDFNRFEENVFPDIYNYVEGELDKGIQPVLITVGDITDENFDLYPHYVNLMSTLPVPIYPVIGNHDHDINNSRESRAIKYYNKILKKSGKGDRAAAHYYNVFFGPEYYAFNLGNDYYIVLDNLIFNNESYWVSVSKIQQDWMKKYLEFVPKGSDVYICMHSPIMNYDSVIDKSYNEWTSLFSDYNLSVISGHTHNMFHKETIPNIFEHNIGAICNIWWVGVDNILNIGADGHPAGYQIFESKENNKVTWRYKSVGYDLNHQIKLYEKLKDHENSIVAYIWAVDDAWKVEGLFDGEISIEGVRTSMTNPDYELYYLRNKPTKISQGRLPKIKDSYFIFDIPIGAKRFTIKAVDRFGNSYEKNLEL